jgi:hypothetical protein
MGGFIYYQYSGFRCQVSASEFDPNVEVTHEMDFLSPMLAFS